MTLLVSNINFNSTGNTQLNVNTTSNAFILKANSSNYSVNTISIVAGNLLINTTSVYLGSRIKNDYQVGDYLVLHANAAQPANTLITNTSYLRSSYTSFLSAWPDDAYPDSPWVAGTIAGSQSPLCYGNSLYVGAGSSGQATSTDLITWTDRSNTSINPNSAATFDITYGAGTTYVAVGGSGITAPYNDCFIMSSTNGGVTWTRRAPATNVNIMYAVAYGASVYVAVGGENSTVNGNAAIQTSTNGTLWTLRTAANVYPYYPTTLVFGAGIFVAGDGVGYQTSTNGATWTYRTATGFNNITFGNNIFVATKFNTNNKTTVLTSTNGLTWTSTELPYYLGSTPYVGYANGLFMLSTYSNSYYILSYDNATTWYLNKTSFNVGVIIKGAPTVALLNTLNSSNLFTYSPTTNFKIRPLANSSFEKTYVVYQ